MTELQYENVRREYDYKHTAKQACWPCGVSLTALLPHMLIYLLKTLAYLIKVMWGKLALDTVDYQFISTIIDNHIV